MRFYYYMFGPSVGSLNVYIRAADGGTLLRKWTKSGTVGQFWDRVDVLVGSGIPGSKFLQVVVEAVAANITSSEGVIGLDDISFSNQCVTINEPIDVIPTTTTAPPCGLTGYQCMNGACINQSQICDFKVDCSSGEDEANCGKCSFETTSCGWYDNSFGDHLWNRTMASQTQIARDVTLRNESGSFMFFDESDASISGLTRMFTPYLQETSTHCEFEFFFYKKEKNMGSVALSLYLIDAKNNVERLWRTDRNSLNDDWQRVQVGLHARKAGFQLYFEASLNEPIDKYNKPLLAIDETNYINCPLTYNTSCLSPNVFKCSNGFCIPDNLVCDFSNDCGDLSDERLCGNYTRCDFENNLDPLCDWNSDDDAELDWLRAKGADFASSLLSFPSFGFFFYLFYFPFGLFGLFLI